MNDAERYALNRIANLTKEIAGCLTPDTLELVIADIEESHEKPIAADLAAFVDNMRWQLTCLVGEG